MLDGTLLYSLLQHVSASLKKPSSGSRKIISYAALKYFFFVQWKSQHLQWLDVLGAETKYNDDIQYTKIIKIPYFSCEKFASTMLSGSRGGNSGIKNLF
jgi:hypothetical protein